LIIQLRERLRRHRQDHEVRDFGKPVCAANQRDKRGFDIDRDPAVAIEQRGLYPEPQPVIVLISDIPIDRKSPGPAERRFRLSLPCPTNA
jgi:hypothetical protein